MIGFNNKNDNFLMHFKLLKQNKKITVLFKKYPRLLMSLISIKYGKLLLTILNRFITKVLSSNSMKYSTSSCYIALFVSKKF